MVTESKDAACLYPELAALAQAAKGDLSLRAVARETGIGVTTVNKMLHGQRVSVESIEAFADGFDLPSAPMLCAAGYSVPGEPTPNPTRPTVREAPRVIPVPEAAAACSADVHALATMAAQQTYLAVVMAARASAVCFPEASFRLFASDADEKV